MLLRDVEVAGRRCDVRVGRGIILQVGALVETAGEEVLDGNRGALIPGLADQHLHLMATAAAQASLDVSQGLVGLAVATPVSGWIRGVGLEHVDLPDRRALDAIRADVPVRLQDRSGALWVLNSIAMSLLGEVAEEPGVDVERGHLWRRDDLLARLPRDVPDVAGVAGQLLRLGFTHLTDATAELDAPAGLLLRAAVPQHLVLLGEPGGPGPYKIVLADHDLPSYDEVRDRVLQARPSPVAVHCVTAPALALLIAALDDVGVVPGDRVEHAAVAPEQAVAWLAARGVAVVTQPSLPVLRAETYARDVPSSEQRDLWRHRSLLRAGVVTACSSDAPYGSLDPWPFLRAARPEAPQAAEVLAGWLLDPLDLRRARRVAVGEPADLCLLDATLVEVLHEPAAERVRAVLLRGTLGF
jgi:predicted amidohydrolase YtcJ